MSLPSSWLLRVAFITTLAAVFGCDDDETKAPVDAMVDAGVDSMSDDATPDAMAGDSTPDGSAPDDLSGDSAPDVLDAAADATLDVAADGSPDAVVSDATTDDAGADAAVTQRLDPLTIPKYQEPLIIPPVMPYESKTAEMTEYAIAVRQFEQQILPQSLPMTTVWSYGRQGDPLPASGSPTTYNYPSFTVEARVNEKVRVKWVNELVDEAGNYLPHLLPVDQTLHWANPPGPIDHKGTDPGFYTGPVPIVTHVHGAHVASTSDGYPEAWYLPDAANIPAGYATQGTWYSSEVPTDIGAAVFDYANDQRASTLWYHDHTLGITRVNVYAGPAGFWILRDDAEDALDLPGPAPKLGDAPGTNYYEVPIVIQDRSFNEDGSLFYPDGREFFDNYAGPYLPNSEVHAIWNPEFFGDAIVVNGRTWPYQEVEPRLYRFRLLNGCNSRFLVLKFDDASLTFHQIGNDGGLLPDAPVEQSQVLMGPAERADVVVDFSQLSVGDEVILLNIGPDEPFKGPSVQQTPADPQTTGQVMKFKVVAATGQGTAGTIPSTLPAVTPLSTTLQPRDLTLNERVDEAADVPVAALLGTGSDGPLTWDDAITETPKVNTTEIWRIINLTEDAHPIHLHLVTFQVLDRIPLSAEAYSDVLDDYVENGGTKPLVEDYFAGPAVAPDAREAGRKDTVIANPGEVTRVIATFDIVGLYVWHCHILEHEDNEMMRPFTVVP